MNEIYKNTPENIISLKSNEIFVFGSNELGLHYGGAAKYAREQFGAKMGISEGITGQTYALPTLDKSMAKRSLNKILESINLLINCARANKSKVFLVTKIGCGIAGFTEQEISSLFKTINNLPNNIILPKNWNKIKSYEVKNE